MNNGQNYFIQLLFVIGAAIGSGVISIEDKLQWLNVCRYVVSILTAQVVRSAVGKLPASAAEARQSLAALRVNLLLLAACVALLVHFQQNLFDTDLVYVYLAYLLVQFAEMMQEEKDCISYGVGMACSYFEGYLVHIIPSDGANFVGFEENIRALEDREGVLFPVKKLFIIITKTLYCPPDLKEFNKGEHVPHLEAFSSLEDVTRSVAGVRNRIYRNTAYKINRPRVPPTPSPRSLAPSPPPPPPPVCLAAECATPLHTLHKVLNNRTLYQQVAHIEAGRVVRDFCVTLRDVIERSPHCRGKCELVYYDNEDPSQNLAEILLDRIRQIEPNFEQNILDRRNENIIEE